MDNNFDNYSLEEDIQIADHPKQKSPSDSENGENKPSIWNLLFRMMINPIEGWKRIRRADYSPELTARKCFYPLIAISSASCFLDLLFTEESTLSNCVIKGITTFVAFFFGFYLVMMLEKIFFPAPYKGIADSEFGKIFVMYNLSTLALFQTFYQCLPMLGPLLAFLPIWTIYLIIRGARFFKFPVEKRNLLVTLLVLFIIASPIIVFWAFDMIL